MKWLHISDIHYNPSDDGQTTARLREKLSDYLRGLKIQADEVFVTGDFRLAGKQEDCDEVARTSVEFILQLAKCVGVEEREHIHIVPGNHDLERYSKGADESGRRRANQRLTNSRKDYDVDNGKFKIRKVDQSNPDFIKSDKEYLLSRFSFFKRVDQLLHPNGSVWSENLQRIHTYSCFEHFNLLYMNTAISCGNGKDRGSLVIDSNDLFIALREI